MEFRLVALVLLYGKVFCESDGDVRLAGGGINIGRIQIYHGGQWGALCTDHFHHNVALVLCSQLDYDTTPISTRSYSRSTDDIILHYVTCVGSEARITDCDISHWGLDGNDTCHSNEEAGVQCGLPVTDPPNNSDGEVRLSDSDESISGRVEIRWMGLWGTICSLHFSDPEATVVCRQLGHVHERFSIKSSTVYGQGNGEIWHVSCNGTESQISECRIERDRDTCSHHVYDVGITCGLTDEDLPTVSPDSSRTHPLIYLYVTLPLLVVGIIGGIVFFFFHKRARLQRQTEGQRVPAGQGHQTGNGSHSSRLSEQERQLKIQNQIRMRNSLRTVDARNQAMLNGQLLMAQSVNNHDSAFLPNNHPTLRPQDQHFHNYVSPPPASGENIFTVDSAVSNNSCSMYHRSDANQESQTTSNPQSEHNTLSPQLPPLPLNTAADNTTREAASQRGSTSPTPRFYRYPQQSQPPPTLPAYATEYDSPYPPSYDSLFSQQFDQDGKVVPVTRRSTSSMKNEEKSTDKTMDTAL